MKFVVFAGALMAMAAQAADQDDIYISVMAGQRFDSVQRFQANLIAGYCPVDSLGVGIGAEQAVAYTVQTPYRFGTRVFSEARWFLEPFEASAGLGWRRISNTAGNTKDDFVLHASSAYLVALTPSMAAKFELQAQYAWNDNAVNKWSGTLGAGLRFLY